MQRRFLVHGMVMLGNPAAAPSFLRAPPTLAVHCTINASAEAVPSHLSGKIRHCLRGPAR
jgi:hypothetical protein